MLSKMAISFDPDATINERVAKVAPVLNDVLVQLEDGRLAEMVGVEKFDEELYVFIDSAGLLDKGRVYQVERVCVHPDNREGDMLVPSNSHDLLCRMVEDGFSFKKWKAFACKMPPPDSDLGAKWRAENEKLQKESKGLLAPFKLDELEIASARGSHGAQALRNLKGAARSPHKSLAPDGYLNAAAVIAVKPSFKAPLEDGVPFDVIPYELAVAVPKLMEMMARLGNSGNDVYQEQTSLQMCIRIWKLALKQQEANKTPNWKEVAFRACIGNGGTAAQARAEQLADFVAVWSGGKSGTVLKDLELYERSLPLKRKLYSSDLAAIAALGEMHDCPRYVPALVKAMLNSPTMDMTNHCDLFSALDFSSVGPTGKNRAMACEANTLMTQATTFLQAYSRLPLDDQKTLVNHLEVRCVMLVQQKKASSRKEFHSLQEIAEAFYQDALKADERLPKWSVLKACPADAKSNQTANSSSAGLLREINFDGTITNSELAARNFVVGKRVQNDKGQYYKITKLHPDLKTVILSKVDAMEEDDDQDDEEGEEEEDLEMDPEVDVEVDRATLLSKWKVVQVTAKTFLTSFADPTKSMDVIGGIIRGQVLQALLAEFNKSSEQHVILLTSPRLAAFSQKKFNVGQMKLVPLTHAIAVLPSAKAAPPGAILAGSVHDFKVYLKSSLQLKDASSTRGVLVQPQFVVKYWAVQRTVDSRKINCEVSMHPITVKFGKETAELAIPCLTNSVAIKDHCELCVLKADAPELAVAEPASKKHKPEPKSEAVAKGGSKGKNKAKGKTKGKGKGKSNKK